MKRHIIHILTILAALLVADVAWGASWNKEASGNYTLDGNHTLSSTIVIANGKTLTLTATKNCTITAGSKVTKQMFDVQPGGTLNIIGAEGKVVTLNGGGTVSLSGNDIKNATFSGTQIEEAIKTGGTLTLNYVKITNVNGTGNGGGILVTSADEKILCGPTTLRNCIIEKCFSSSGSAIHLAGQTANENKVSSNFPISVEESTIRYCKSSGSDGGTIRTNGSGVSDIYLKGVTVEHNYTEGSGGGIYWNASGSSSTKCVFDGCTFTNNEAKNKGGAMMLESSFEFVSTGSTTTVSNNIAGTSSGGIFIKSYQGGAFSIPESGHKYYMTYTFTDKLIVENNTAPVGGGINFEFEIYDLNDDFTNNANNSNTLVHTTINIEGAKIRNNSATNGEGGGIRIWNKTASWEGNKRRIEYVVNVSGGEISNNTSTTYGGGIYTLNTDIQHGASTTLLKISGNSATTYGGGIYVEGGTSIDLATTEISENSANDGGALAISASSGNNLSITLGNSTISGNHVTNQGGAIYLPKGTLTIANPTISSNYAKTGGAIYIGGGSLKSTGNAKIENNYSTGAGGAFYVTGGTVQLAGATISGNGKSGSTVKTTDGGAIYVTGNGAGLTATGTITVSDNAATTNGGAVYVNGGSISLAGNTFTGNHAKIGGAVYQTGGSLTASGNSTVQSNYSTAEGGAFYVTGGTVQLAGATISGNGKSGSEVKTTDGGAIYVTGSGAGLKITGTTSISSNASTRNGGAIFVNNGSIELATNSFSGNSAASGGAVYLTTGNIKAGASTIENNYATGNGGAFYVENGNVEVTSATISGNGKNGSAATTDNGGAIYVKGTDAGFTATGDASILSNAAENEGGAIYVNGGNITLAKNTISNNSAATGGALYVEGGGFSAAGTTEMASNSASGDGGAIYVNEGDINITGQSSTLNLSGNNASNGGVFYVNDGSITADKISKATISNNYSTAEGGAFYVTGGSINLCDTELSGNGKNGSEVTTTNGGAIALYNGTFSFADGSEIRDNHATRNGGGLYIYNSPGATKVNIECLGGSYINNTAALGGALYADGPIGLVFAANIQNNKAVNGGGLYLAGGIDMTFGKLDTTDPKKSLSGLIVGNEAKGTGESGVGGGIYLGNGTLQFALSQNFKELGIYNNSASYEAADIYGSGDNSKIYLPDISGMNLNGFNVPGSDLYWVKDFNSKRYEAELRKAAPEIESMILKYGNGDNEQEINSITTKIITSKICLDLGYDLVFVTFTPVNLAENDNAAIMISYPGTRTGKDDNLQLSDPIEYRKVVFTGKNPQVVGLPTGYWNLKATEWTYAYESNTTFAPPGSNSFDSAYIKEFGNASPKDFFVNINNNHNKNIEVKFTPKIIDGFNTLTNFSARVINIMTPSSSN